MGPSLWGCKEWARTESLSTCPQDYFFYIRIWKIGVYLLLHECCLNKISMGLITMAISISILVIQSHLTLLTLWAAAGQASLSFTISQSLLKLVSIESVMPSSHLDVPFIQPSVVPFSSCPQSFPASGSFLVRQLFASGGQSIGVSVSASGLPMNTRDWFPLGWTGQISLQSKG